MIDHIGLEVEDFERSKAFYERTLAPLGFELLMEPVPGAAGFGRRSDQKPFFWVSERGRQATSGMHVAFQTDSREVVDAFHNAALDAGAEDNGEPGPRPIYHQHYYGAFVRDPDGNNIEAVCHLPA